MDISFNPVTDITPLKDLPLKKLRIYSNKPKPNATSFVDVILLPFDLSPLSNITTLEYLMVSGAGQTLPDLTKLVNLTSLTLFGLDMKDLCKFRNSKKLKSLSLSNGTLTSLKCIENFTNLEDLQVRRVNITDLSALQNLQKLKKLTLVKVPVSDVKPLAKLKSLESLTFYKTNIKYLSPLRESKSLEYVTNESRLKLFTTHMLTGGLQSWFETVGDRSLDHCSPIDIKEIKADISCFEKDGTLKPWWKRMLRQ